MTLDEFGNMGLGTMIYDTQMNAVYKVDSQYYSENVMNRSYTLILLKGQGNSSIYLSYNNKERYKLLNNVLKELTPAEFAVSIKIMLELEDMKRKFNF